MVKTPLDDGQLTKQKHNENSAPTEEAIPDDWDQEQYPIDYVLCSENFDDVDHRVSRNLIRNQYFKFLMRKKRHMTRQPRSSGKKNLPSTGLQVERRTKPSAHGLRRALLKTEVRSPAGVSSSQQQ